MRVEVYDWTGRKLSNALVMTAKAKCPHPMRAICSPGFFATLMVQGFSAKAYNSTFSEYQEDFDGVRWQMITGIPDDALIISNLDEIHVFTNIKGGVLKREGDQMPEWLEFQEQKLEKAREILSE